MEHHTISLPNGSKKNTLNPFYLPSEEHHPEKSHPAILIIPGRRYRFVSP